jgi:hypothetical protein
MNSSPITDEMIEAAKAELFGRGIVDTFSIKAALEAALRSSAPPVMGMEEMERLREIAAIADELVNGDGLYTVAYADTPKLCVRERKDGSDPHARLCDALKALSTPLVTGRE